MDNIMETRHRIRFSPDIGAHAEIGVLDANGNFILEKAALIVDESYSGVGLIVIHDEKYIPGFECILKIGNLGPIKGRIIWTKLLDENTSRAGVNYLD
jgi:hypothetical protein